MTDLETFISIFNRAKIPVHYDVVHDTQKHFGTRELTVHSRTGPTGECGYMCFYGVFFFNDNGELTEFGSWE